MSTKFSAHPDLAVEQLQRAELIARQNPNKSYAHHRRHHSTGSGLGSGKGFPSSSYIGSPSTSSKLKFAVPQNAKPTSNATETKLSATASVPVTDLSCTFPHSSSVRNTNVDVLKNKFAYDADVDVDTVDKAYIDDIDLKVDDDVYIQTSSRSSKTKDYVDCTSSTLRWSAVDASKSLSVDEPDHLQHRFSRTPSCNSRHPEPKQQEHHHGSDYYTADPRASPIHAISDGCVSGLSSALSSPSASTVSSPLSTPTRLAPHFQQQHSNCCQKSLADGCGREGCSVGHHMHHPPHHHHTLSSKSTPKAPSAPSAAVSKSASASSGCKKLQKFDPRLGPSRYRQLLPVVLCILSFAIVFSILIVYMDTTEIRHKQFRLNMSRDYEFFGVAQDDPALIAFLREIQMTKYTMHSLNHAPLDDTTSTAAASSTTHFNFSAQYVGLAPEMAHYVADLVGGKENGAVIQSLPGAMGHLMTAPWLAATLNWAGVVVEPEPRRFFTLLKQNAQRPRLQVVHACISPNPYPKEVTIHNEESEVRINSLLDEETSWFNSRVKCFPLYSVMLAYNRVEYDLLSLGVHGHELEILQTLPFDMVQIEVISIHLSEDIARGYVDALTKFLADKSYKLQKAFGRNYFYQRIKTTSRTRKKDILLLKTP